MPVDLSWGGSAGALARPASGRATGARELHSPAAMDGQDEQDARDERQPRDARGDKAEERRAAAELAQARLRASIDGTRAELVSTLGELRGVVAGQLDWREWVRRHPLLCMAVVAGVGFRLGRGRD